MHGVSYYADMELRLAVGLALLVALAVVLVVSGVPGTWAGGVLG